MTKKQKLTQSDDLIAQIRKAPLDDGTPRPLRLDNRWPSRIDEHRAFHCQVPK